MSDTARPTTPPFQEDFFERVVNVNWGGVKCSFAVCGYDGNFEGGDTPVFFGVGAYSDDGKAWTKFQVFQNGSTASVFNMRDPNSNTKNIVVVGGCTNDATPASTAALMTIVGSGVSATGETADGRNVANFGSLGYDTVKGTFYAVDHTVVPNILHQFQIIKQKPSVPQPDPKQPTILWAGQHYPELSPVYDCTCVGSPAVMKFKGKDGKQHTLIRGGATQLSLDGVDITPSNAAVVLSAAGGVNDVGENIIIAVGYSQKDGLPGIAWWAIDGKDWTEINGLWIGEPVLQSAEMATAVPNSLSTATKA